MRVVSVFSSNSQSRGWNAQMCIYFVCLSTYLPGGVDRMKWVLIDKECMKFEWSWKYPFIPKIWKFMCIATSVKNSREKKKNKNVFVPLLSPIPPGHHFSQLRQTRWLLCVRLRYGLGCTLSDRPLHTFLCSPPASLGRWTNWFGRWLFKGHIS